jgi:hypothetical protein
MKVIIEMNEYVSIESVADSPNEVKIIFKNVDGQSYVYDVVGIEDLKLALRKMTAK